jgi:amidase
VRRLEKLLRPGDLLCLPTTPRPAPLRGLEVEDIEIAYRHRAMALLCSAGLAGLPQISLPLGAVGGLPIGLSLMGRFGTDIDLLGVAQLIGGTVAAAQLPGETGADRHDGRRGRAALMT